MAGCPALAMLHSSPSPLPLSRIPPVLDSPLPVARRVFHNAHFTLEVNDASGIVLCTRGERPFAAVREFEQAMGEVCNVMDGLGRSRHAFLMDVRAATGRNDAAFDTAIIRMNHRSFGGFAKVGMLAQTAVGQLQLQRHARHDGITRRISSDKAELWSYLQRR